MSLSYWKNARVESSNSSPLKSDQKPWKKPSYKDQKAPENSQVKR